MSRLNESTKDYCICRNMDAFFRVLRLPDTHNTAVACQLRSSLAHTDRAKPGDLRVISNTDIIAQYHDCAERFLAADLLLKLPQARLLY